MLGRFVQVALAIGFLVCLASVWSAVSTSLQAPHPGARLDPRDSFSNSQPNAPREPAAASLTRPAEAPPTAEELALKRELEARLRAEARKDRIVTVQGRVIEGRIIEESASGVRILRSFGDSGQMEMTLTRAGIRSIERNHAEAPPPITIRDVRFKLEFPNFNLYRRPPFTIMTDQRFLEVEDAMRTLAELHGDLLRVFSPLVRDRERRDGIQLLFFSDQRQFDAYREEFAPALAQASGFYSPRKDRLVVYDQTSAEWVDEVNQHIDGQREAYRGLAAQRGAAAALHDWHQSARRTLGSIAERANRAILRHEGAHQLFHTYGVHADHGVEHLWLIEGLATYCEEPGEGAASLRAEELRGSHASRLLPFSKLVNFASREGIGQLGSQAEIDLFYAKAWFMVEYLMHEHRDEFFAYIRYIRDPANLREVERTEDFDLLSRFLGRSPQQLAHELDQALSKSL